MGLRSAVKPFTLLFVMKEPWKTIRLFSGGAMAGNVEELLPSARHS
jgi:hypothetical protein